jgi:hypothetical protein
VELYLHSPNAPSWHGAQLKTKKAQGLYLFLPLLLLSRKLWDKECMQHARRKIACIWFGDLGGIYHLGKLDINGKMLL